MLIEILFFSTWWNLSYHVVVRYKCNSRPSPHDSFFVSYSSRVTVIKRRLNVHVNEMDVLSTHCKLENNL